jgi:hypothetical protein
MLLPTLQERSTVTNTKSKLLGEFVEFLSEGIFNDIIDNYPSLRNLVPKVKKYVRYH